jgi:hypothetical protein
LKKNYFAFEFVDFVPIDFIDERYLLVCYLLSETELTNPSLDTNLKNVVMKINMQTYEKVVHLIPLGSIEVLFFNYYELSSREANDDTAIFERFLKTTFGFIIKEANYIILKQVVKKVKKNILATIVSALKNFSFLLSFTKI